MSCWRKWTGRGCCSRFPSASWHSCSAAGDGSRRWSPLIGGTRRSFGGADLGGAGVRGYGGARILLTQIILPAQIYLASLPQTYLVPPYPRTSEIRPPEIRSSICVYAVFLSYATSLIIPRLGEFTRCGVLKRYDGCSFSKALGTVVTERAIDTLLMGTVAGLTLLFQLSIFGTFFTQTGTSLDTIFERFSLTGYLVTAVCAVAILILLHILFQSLNIYSKVKATASGIWQGVTSLKDVKNLPLFIFFTLGIWVSYFLHYYMTFFCFEATSHLGLACALVTFVVGSIAVIVPTPNGAGPWHFAVKTMLILYGVVDEYALYFVLIVHTVQTMLVVVLGIYAWVALSFSKVRGRGGAGVRE